MRLVGPICLLALTVAGARAEDVAPGTPIVAIRVVRHDVFDLDDPKTSAAPYRWVDALHVITRENFIRSLLLFHVGDPLDPVVLAESAILLRSTGILNPVTISAHAAPGGAEVVVETRDQWTIGFDAAYDVAGGRRQIGGTISDDNLLGTGKSVLFGRSSDADRTSSTLGYKDLTVHGSRWQIDTHYTMSSDGYDRFLRVQYPFFALTTPRAGGVDFGQVSADRHLWSEAHWSVTGPADTQYFETWFGIRMPGTDIRINRLIVGAFGEEATYGDWNRTDGTPYPRPEDRELLGPEVGWEHQTFNWKVVQGFRSWQRQEDLPLGPNWKVMTGLSTPAFGGARTRLRYRAALDMGRWRRMTYMWTNALFTGRVENGEVTNGISHLELGGAVTGNAGFRLRVAADFGHNLDLDRQLTLGADTGLRGYEPDFFDGTSRVVTNVEWRHRLTGEFLHIAVLGVTVFGDAGRSWAARVGPSTDGWRGDIGAGLLIEITRASHVRIVRLEAALPDRGGSPVYQVTTQSLF